jgi:hypothetical protein
VSDQPAVRPVDSPLTAPPTRAIGVRTWCVVRGAVDAGQLEGFDLVVVCHVGEAGQTWLGLESLGRLRAGGTRVVRHVPLAGPAAGPEGRDEWFQQALAIVRTNVGPGWDGCYLDDLADVAAVPGGTEQVIALIHAAHDATDGGIVIIQAVDDPAVTAQADLVGTQEPLLG